MAGASEKHELIKGNLFAAIHGHLRGGLCKAYSSDFKLRPSRARLGVPGNVAPSAESSPVTRET
jgi:hypothetical protein